MINIILKEQLKNGVFDKDSGIEHDNYTEKDLEAILPIVKSALISNGFRFPNKKQFEEKIKNIFNRSVNEKPDLNYLYINYFDPCKDFNAHSSGINTGGIFVIKNECFITFLLTVPELLDYQKIYPELASYEKNLAEFNKGTIKYWKDVKSLANNRKRNIQAIIARNKYFLMGDNSQLHWLCINDKVFVQRIVLSFWYMDDKKLVDFVLKNIKYSWNNSESNPDDFGMFFWRINCVGNVIINNKAFDILRETISPENLECLNSLADYVIYLFRNTNIEFTNQAKILGHLLHLGQSIVSLPIYEGLYPQIGRIEYSANEYIFLFTKLFAHLDFEDRYTKEFENKNYYDLFNLKEWWQIAKKNANEFISQNDYIEQTD